MYSPIGRTRTIPTATEDIARTRIAYFSCSQLVTPSILYIQTGGLKPAVVHSGSSLCPHHSRVSDLAPADALVSAACSPLASSRHVSHLRCSIPVLLAACPTHAHMPHGKPHQSPEWFCTPPSADGQVARMADRNEVGASPADVHNCLCLNCNSMCLWCALPALAQLMTSGVCLVCRLHHPRRRVSGVPRTKRAEPLVLLSLASMRSVIRLPHSVLPACCVTSIHGASCPTQLHLRGRHQWQRQHRQRGGPHRPHPPAGARDSQRAGLPHPPQPVQHGRRCVRCFEAAAGTFALIDRVPSCDWRSALAHA